MPDYVAIRPTTSQSEEWAIVESKGTNKSFKSLTVCPRPWRNQVRNVDLFLSEMPLVPHRYLVVATRVNPNAKTPATRALHVRAWNSAEKSQAIDGQAAVEIASAHLFGLFKNLGLWHNARAVAFAPWRRNSIDLRRWPIPSDNLNELAIKELEGNELGIQQVPGGRFFVISSEFGEIQVELSRPLLDLASTLREATELTTAMKALRKADGEIDDWTHSTEQLADHGRERILSYGARIHFPSRFPFKDE